MYKGGYEQWEINRKKMKAVKAVPVVLAAAAVATDEVCDL